MRCIDCGNEFDEKACPNHPGKVMLCVFCGWVCPDCEPRHVDNPDHNKAAEECLEELRAIYND